MAPLKAFELRKNSDTELLKKLGELKTELAGLRVAQATGGAAARLARIKGVRKDIARIMTVHNEKQREAARAKYAKSKRVPKDLRLKFTKAKRLALTPAQLNKLTPRAAKSADRNKLLNFAVVA